MANTDELAEKTNTDENRTIKSKKPQIPVILYATTVRGKATRRVTV